MPTEETRWRLKLKRCGEMVWFCGRCGALLAGLGSGVWLPAPVAGTKAGIPHAGRLPGLAASGCLGLGAGPGSGRWVQLAGGCGDAEILFW